MFMALAYAEISKRRQKTERKNGYIVHHQQ